MSDIGTKEKNTSVLDESVGRKKTRQKKVKREKAKREKAAELRQVMLRIKPELYSALQVIVLGRPEMSLDLRKGSVAAIIRQIVEKHEAEILEEAAKYLRCSFIQAQLTRSPDGLLTRRLKK
jgi:hypothetical protein